MAGAFYFQALTYKTLWQPGCILQERPPEEAFVATKKKEKN